MAITTCYRILPADGEEPAIAPNAPFTERYRLIGDSSTDTTSDVLLSGTLPLVGSHHRNPDWPFTVTGVAISRQSSPNSLWLAEVAYTPTAWLPPPEAVWTHSREYRTDDPLREVPAEETH